MAKRMRSIAGFEAWLAAGVAAANLAWMSPGVAEQQLLPVQSSVAQLFEGAPTSSQDPVPPPADGSMATSPLDGLKIYSQSWRRGGLGAKALMTFTLRNANDYAVKDIEIACTFTRRDGRYLTDRKRVIGETVKMKSRRTFRRVHVGFVNVNAAKAKCVLVAASRA